MKLAVTAWDLSSVEALQRIPDQAAKAEAMGFEGFWLPENHFAGPAALSAPHEKTRAVAGAGFVTRQLV